MATAARGCQLFDTANHVVKIISLTSIWTRHYSAILFPGLLVGTRQNRLDVLDADLFEQSLILVASESWGKHMLRRVYICLLSSLKTYD